MLNIGKQLNKEHAEGINQLAIDKRIGNDYRQNKWYEKLKDEIFIYDGKTRRIEEMLDIVDGIYKKDFQDFGSKWLWSRDSKGNRVDWKTIDIDKQYGVINEYIKYISDGSLDINNFLRKMAGA